MQPLLLWKSNEYSITYSECVCSLWYPACNAHTPYRHLWPVRLYNIFPLYLINGMIFGKKKVINLKICVDFLYDVWVCLKHFEARSQNGEKRLVTPSCLPVCPIARTPAWNNSTTIGRIFMQFDI